MSLSFLSAKDTVETSGTPPTSSPAPPCHFDAATGPLPNDPLVTVSITALPDPLSNAQTGPPSLTSSLPDTHAAIVTAFLGGGGGGGGNAGATFLVPTELPLPPQSNSVCSSELNRLLLSHTPRSSPQHSRSDAVGHSGGGDDGDGGDDEDGDRPPHEHRPYRSQATYGESRSLEDNPSLSNFSQHPQDSELVTATTDPITSMLHSTAAAPPSLQRRLQGCSSASSSASEEPEANAAVAASVGCAAAPLHFVKDEDADRADVAASGDVVLPPSRDASPTEQHVSMEAEPASPASSAAKGDDTTRSQADGEADKSCGSEHESAVPSSPPSAAAPQLKAAATPPPPPKSTTHCTTTTSTASTPTPQASLAPRAGASSASATAMAPNAALQTASPPSPPRSPCTTLSTTTLAAAAAAAAAPSPVARLSHAKPPSRITAWIRSRVSQNKVRFREGDFNLDLTYITPHIIAMGYPAHGTEYYIRNPIDEVERFFDERHAGHYRIYNLCSERAYDNPRRFHGCFRRFPFDDHNVPSLSLVLQFVLDAATYLDADAANVVAVHCKAGKGRTGVMVSCLLYYLYPNRFATANEAMRFFDQQRTCDGEGMTIPSQRRYVQYFEKIVRDHHGALPPAQRRLAIKEVILRVSREGTIVHPGDLYFIISDHHQMLLDSRMWFPRGPTVSSAGCVFSFTSLKEGAVPSTLLGDVKFSFFRRRPIVLSGKESTACYLWFNTTLCPSLQMVYQRADLDKVDVAAVGKNVSVSLSFAQVVERGSEKEAAVTAAPASLPQDGAPV